MRRPVALELGPGGANALVEAFAELSFAVRTAWTHRPWAHVSADSHGVPHADLLIDIHYAGSSDSLELKPNSWAPWRFAAE